MLDPKQGAAVDAPHESQIQSALLRLDGPVILEGHGIHLRLLPNAHVVVERAVPHPIILDECFLDRELISETPIDILNSNDCYLQHFEEMHKHIQLIDSLPDETEKTNKVLELLEEAGTNIQRFNNLPNNTYSINSDHIKQYSDAIKLVEEANFI